jgi:hypothetical protein
MQQKRFKKNGSALLAWFCAFTHGLAWWNRDKQLVSSSLLAVSKCGSRERSMLPFVLAAIRRI